MALTSCCTSSATPTGAPIRPAAAALWSPTAHPAPSPSGPSLSKASMPGRARAPAPATPPAGACASPPRGWTSPSPQCWRTRSWTSRSGIGKARWPSKAPAAALRWRGAGTSSSPGIPRAPTSEVRGHSPLEAWTGCRRLEGRGWLGIKVISPRRARFTASESGKYFWTSGSSITAPSAKVKCWTLVVPSARWIFTVCPWRYACACFPRTPPRKSYSGSMSSESDRGGSGIPFFIDLPFCTCRFAAADQANRLSSLSVHDYEEAFLGRKPDVDVAVLSYGMPKVINGDGQRITQHRLGFLEGNSVLAIVAFRLFFVPLENQCHGSPNGRRF